MTIFEALRKDHDIQRDLLARLVETHGDSEERDTLYQQVRAELKYHANAEERALYIPHDGHRSHPRKKRATAWRSIMRSTS